MKIRTNQLVADEFDKLSERDVRVKFEEVVCELGDDLCVGVRLERVPFTCEKFRQIFEVCDDSWKRRPNPPLRQITFRYLRPQKKARTRGQLKWLAERLTIVYDDKLVVLIRSVRMGIPFAWHAVGGPTGVRHPDVDVQRVVKTKRLPPYKIKQKHNVRRKKQT